MPTWKDLKRFCQKVEWELYKKCFGTSLKTTERFIKEVFDLVGNEYEVKGKYVNALTKIKVKHNICNFLWNVKTNHFLTGIIYPY
jgi:hypothetical protein